MKLIKKEYVKVLEWGFKIAYLLLGLATFNVFLYDSPVQPLLVKICLALGADLFRQTGVFPGLLENSLLVGTGSFLSELFPHYGDKPEIRGFFCRF